MNGKRTAGIAALTLTVAVVAAAPQLASSAAGMPTTTTAAVPKPTAPPPDTTIAPLVLTDVGVALPAVAGYTAAPRTSVPPEWPLQLNLPHQVAGAAHDVQRNGVGIGSVIIVEGLDLAGYVTRLFDAPVSVHRDTEQSEDGRLMVANQVRSGWQSFDGIPVVAATSPDGNVGEWVWGHDGHTWIALGTLALSDYVDALISMQQAALPSNAYDYELLAGPLYDLAAVPGYGYVDLPVADALHEIPNSFWGDCAQRLWLGYIVTDDDPEPLLMAPEDLALFAATIGGVCAEGGFFTDLDGALDDMAMSDESIGAVTVRRDDHSVIAIDGNDVYHFSTSDPATLTAMEPFLFAFVAGLG